VPLHALRHTAAAAWLGTGRSLEFVRAQLGHSSAKVTSDYYGHLEQQFAPRASPTPRRASATLAAPAWWRCPKRRFQKRRPASCSVSSKAEAGS
jgi:integrase